jgi:glutamate-ammonia-ligase adenylyltransferase
MASAEAHLSALKPLCAGIDDEVLRDFVTRMDPEYFRRFPPHEIARHITLVDRLHPEASCQVTIDAAANGLYDILIVAYDYFSEMAGICGLLTAFGLDIREGEVYTFLDAAPGAPASRAPGRRRPTKHPGLARKKIVDVFRVQPDPADAFSPLRQRAFIEALQQFVQALDEQRYAEARRMVNRRLAETLGRARGRSGGLLKPIDIRFDNRLSPTDTVMDIRSPDTPGFLYAFANALAMRGLYFSKARITQVGSEIHDRFWVRGRHGQKLESPDDHEELRVTATLIKQFTHFLGSAPDPGKAMEHFDLFLDGILRETHGQDSTKALAFLRDKKTLGLLARLLGTSDFLWEDFLRRQHANLLPMLHDFRHMPLIRPRAQLAKELRRRVAAAKTDERKQRALNQYKDAELFRIDMVHLMDPGSTLPDFSRALTELAEVVLQQGMEDGRRRLDNAHGRPRLHDGGPCPFALFGLGKFGGCELGYASDIEIMAVYGGPGRTSGRQGLDNTEYFERLMQDLLQRIEAKQEGIFHLDVRLRPHGGKGLLANTLDEVRVYYSADGMAAAFERQALIKLRYVGGDAGLGRQVEAHRDAFVYSGRPWDIAAALALRREQIREFADTETINVKYSRGGLIDVEYAVQYLQLLHGHEEPCLRSTNTLTALDGLMRAGVLSVEEARTLREAYLFLRTLIDGLRIVRGHAKDLLLPPETSEEFVFLARRLGFETEDWNVGALQLSRKICEHMQRTHEFFTRRFGTI